MEKALQVKKFVAPKKKKELQEMGAVYAMQLIENEFEPARSYIALKRLQEFINGAIDAIKDRAKSNVEHEYLNSKPGEAEILGAKVQWYPGKAIYNFTVCPGYVRRRQKLEKINEQMNAEIEKVKAKYMQSVTELENEITNIEKILPSGSYIDPETGEVTDQIYPVTFRKDTFRVVL